MSDPTHPERIELVEEQAKVTRTEVERGRVVVRTRVEERDELVEVALRRDHVAVEHVPIGIVVETAPAVREEDGVLIVPVVEEQLVVRTQLVLKKEIRITRRQHVETVREPVRLRSEHAEVVRMESQPADPAITEELPS
jgi:stress response protein YsnF